MTDSTVTLLVRPPSGTEQFIGSQITTVKWLIKSYQAYFSTLDNGAYSRDSSTGAYRVIVPNTGSAPQSVRRILRAAEFTIL